MRLLMRYNKWQTDPYSQGSAEKVIAARGDLQPVPQDLGNIDAKLAGADDVMNMRFEAVSGPTHETQPVFDWDNASITALAPHYGQPQRFDFGWVMFDTGPSASASAGGSAGGGAGIHTSHVVL